MDDPRRLTVLAFLAMEHHVSDCWQCRRAERIYKAAVETGQPVGAIARQFCPEMQELAKRLAHLVRR